MKKILIIEDEQHIAEGIKLNLELAGHETKVAPDGKKGVEAWKLWEPDLIVLDIMMPEMDGYQVLEHIRKEDHRLPILILSARNESQDKVKALKKGVDDYLGKPFNLDEFLLRVERLLLRGQWSLAEPEQVDNLSFGDNSIDFIQGTANCVEGVVQLTIQELKLIKYFVDHPSKPLTREELLKAGWGYDEGTNTRTLDNFMVRFRKYFEKDPKNPVHFKSVRSIGYRFDP